MSDERLPLTFEQACAALEVRESEDGRRTVHCFIEAGPGLLIGADWDEEHVHAEMREHGVEAAGPGALAMRHGVGVRHGRRVYFFATREGWEPPA
jgi:hypothetical protein